MLKLGRWRGTKRITRKGVQLCKIWEAVDGEGTEEDLGFSLEFEPDDIIDLIRLIILLGSSKPGSKRVLK